MYFFYENFNGTLESVLTHLNDNFKRSLKVKRDLKTYMLFRTEPFPNYRRKSNDVHVYFEVQRDIKEDAAFLYSLGALLYADQLGKYKVILPSICSLAKKPDFTLAAVDLNGDSNLSVSEVLVAKAFQSLNPDIFDGIANYGRKKPKTTVVMISPNMLNDLLFLRLNP